MLQVTAAPLSGSVLNTHHFTGSTQFEMGSFKKWKKIGNLPAYSAWTVRSLADPGAGKGEYLNKSGNTVLKQYLVFSFPF